MPFAIKGCDVTDKLFTADFESGKGCINKNQVRK